MEDISKIEQVSREIQTCVEKKILGLTKKAGIYCRIFSRVKSIESMEKKMRKKDYNIYKKMQDILGVRIIFYFNEDVDIFKQYLKHNFCYAYDSESTTLSDIEQYEWQLNDRKKRKVELHDKLFMPTRLNVVFRINDELKGLYDKLFVELQKEKIAIEKIDYTFEVQFRTVLSEGWHEVEHDLRYKCSDVWEGMDNESRILNGIYASLETNEHAMDLLFTNMARKYYFEGKWEPLLRCMTRLQIHGDLSKKIEEYLSQNKELCKAILKQDRKFLIRCLLSVNPGYVDVTMDNIVLLINHLQDENVRDENLEDYAQKEVYGISGIDREKIVNRIQQEQAKDTLDRLVERSINIDIVKEILGGHIISIKLKKTISQVPTREFFRIYKRYLGFNNEVVLDINEVQVLSNDFVGQYIVPALLSSFYAEKAIWINWNGLYEEKSKQYQLFKQKIRKTIEQIIEVTEKSNVVPNSIPEVIIDAYREDLGYRVYLNDIIYLTKETGYEAE